MSSRYGLEIRGATEADAPGLAELMRAAGQDVAVRVLAERLGALQDSHGTALIALEWGPPSGIVVLDWHHTLDADLATARITTLLVGPGERRRGIGRLLLKAAAQAARAAGCGTLHVSAAREQEGLSDFCRAAGFSESGTGFIRPLRKRGAVARHVIAAAGVAPGDVRVIRTAPRGRHDRRRPPDPQRRRNAT